MILSLLSACNEVPEERKSHKRQQGRYSVPVTNTVVASDKMRITDDLNELFYTIEVVATPRSDKGEYEVLASYGHNDASARITMPEANPPLLPEIRRGNAPYSYIIGFRREKDTSFKEYFQVQATKGKTEMKYLKAYSFQ